MLTNSEFGKRLSKERKRLRLTQANFAEACGVKPASQFLYEKGERSPNAQYLIKASDIGVHISYLFQSETTRFDATVLSTDDLARMYFECDYKCRDTKGRLLDVEYRMNFFKKLIEKHANKNIA